MESFKGTVKSFQNEEIRSKTELKTEISQLSRLNQQLSTDAQHLANALKSDVKIQGTWGEERLQLILESEGLEKYLDFTTQRQFRDVDEEKNRKPDYILSLPDGKCLIIDCKVTLSSYIDYFNQNDVALRAGHLTSLVESIRSHIDSLSSKNYQSLHGLPTNPEFVFMFMPFESALTLALNQDPSLLERAAKKNIVIVTPMTLIATLKVVTLLWKNAKRIKNVETIFKECGKLYDKFVLFITDFQKLGSSLSAASNAYHDAFDKLKEGKRRGETIIGRFEGIKNLEAKTTKALPADMLEELDLLGEEEQTVEPLPATGALPVPTPR